MLNKPEKALLPHDWEYEHLVPDRPRYVNKFTGEWSIEKPAASQKSFSSMAFSAARIWIPRISQTREDWSEELAEMNPTIRKIYYDALQVVLDATLKFSFLESEDGPTHASNFDRYLHAARLIPFQDLSPYSTCPVAKLEQAQVQCSSLLSKIQAFIFELKDEKDRVTIRTKPEHYATSKTWSTICSRSPPSLSVWREMQMPQRAAAIYEKALQWSAIQHSLSECREWFESRSEIQSVALRCCRTLQELKLLQYFNNCLKRSSMLQWRPSENAVDLVRYGLSVASTHLDEEESKVPDGWTRVPVKEQRLVYFVSPDGQLTSPVSSRSDPSPPGTFDLITDSRLEDRQVIEAMVRHYPIARRYEGLGWSAMNLDTFLNAEDKGYIDGLRTREPIGDTTGPQLSSSMEDLRELINGHWAFMLKTGTTVIADYNRWLTAEKYDPDTSSLFFSGSGGGIQARYGLSKLYGRANYDGSIWFIELTPQCGRIFAGVSDRKNRVILGKWGSGTGVSQWQGYFKQVKFTGADDGPTRLAMQQECASLKADPTLHITF